MITLQIDCSMCGEKQPLFLEAETTKEFTLESLKLRLKKEGWIMQVNGDHIDTYCTKKCAK